MNNVSTYQYLKFVPLKDFYDWDYETYFRPEGINHHYPLVKLSNVLKHRNEYITINDEQKYKRCKVQLYGRGIVLRDIAKGKDIKVKRQQVCQADEILVAEIDAKVGGYGLLPKDLEGAIVSSHYFLFQIDFEQIDKDYLDIYLKTDEFFKQVKSTGSTNYAAIRPYHFLDYKIALPPKDVQRKLVDAYQSAIREAADATNHAAEIEQSIENYLLDELGIEIVKNKIKKGLQFVSYKDVSRWSLEAILGEAVQIIKDKKYPLRKLGTLCTSKSGGTPSKGVANYWKGDIPWVSPKDMKVDFISQAEDTISREAVKESSAPLLEEGSLLMVVRSGILQRMLPVAINLVPVSINQDMRAFKLTSNEILIHYLFLYLKYSQKDVLRMVKSSTTVESIDSGNIDEFEIPLPPLSIQEGIVSEITTRREQIKTLRETAKAKREQATAEFENALFEI